MVNQQITTEKGSDNQQALIPRILVTLQILLVSRLGGFIPIPGIDYDAFYLNINNMAMTKSLSMFSNGACSSISIFSLGIIPSINAFILVLLVVLQNSYHKTSTSLDRIHTQLDKYYVSTKFEK